MDSQTIADNAAFFTKMWMEFATRMMTAGTSFNPFAPPPEAARQARGSYFGALSEFADQMMRSPQFLQLMKQSMDTSLGMRKQMDDFMTGLRHDTQGTAKEDIDSLMVTVRHLGTRMRDRMDEIDDHLREISRRLDAMEGNGNGNGRAAPRRNGTGRHSDLDAEPVYERAAERLRAPQAAKVRKGARRKPKREADDIM
ncbi:MAG TPA: hypothetical protein VG269_08840 [Tepidisphaeraceae bacterium]|nr:hypothetical protein [Tepidisphaeraceae bacterium]